MIKPIRCKCGQVLLRRQLQAAVDSGVQFVCPNSNCRLVMPAGKIEEFLIARGEIRYDTPQEAEP